MMSILRPINPFFRPSSSACEVVLQDGPCSFRRTDILLSSPPALESENMNEVNKRERWHKWRHSLGKNTIRSRQRSSSLRHCRILRNNSVQKITSPGVVLRRTRTHPRRPAEEAFSRALERKDSNYGVPDELYKLNPCRVSVKISTQHLVQK